MVAGLAARGVRIRRVCAGVPGDRSIDMLARFQADVLAVRPEWLVLSCGVNDVWHGERGCTVEQLRGSVAAMLEGARAAGVSVLLTTATVVGEDLDALLNRGLEPYNEALRDLAAAHGLPLADCSAAFHDALRAPGAVAGTWLTVDGVHFNARGETTMARAVLRAWPV